MSLPPYTDFGFLPIGEHVGTFNETYNKYVRGDQIREPIWKDFLILKDKVINTHCFKTIEILGSFLSVIEDPHDIDVVLEFKSVEKPDKSVQFVFDQKKIKTRYKTDLLDSTLLSSR